MRAPQSERNTLIDWPAVTADILERLRERRPRVHCITNAVAQAFTANMLLAAGTVPSASGDRLLRVVMLATIGTGRYCGGSGLRQPQ